MTITVVDAGPHKISRTVEVQVPVAELFDIVADPYRHGELDGSVRSGLTLRCANRRPLMARPSASH
jgi:hypothetical protein